jgi:hypothetical protein
MIDREVTLISMSNFQEQILLICCMFCSASVAAMQHVQHDVLDGIISSQRYIHAVYRYVTAAYAAKTVQNGAVVSRNP